MVVDALEVAVGLIINLLTKVLVCLGPHLREVSCNRGRKTGYHTSEKNLLANSLFSLHHLVSKLVAKNITQLCKLTCISSWISQNLLFFGPQMKIIQIKQTLKCQKDFEALRATFKRKYSLRHIALSQLQHHLQAFILLCWKVGGFSPGVLIFLALKTSLLTVGMPKPEPIPDKLVLRGPKEAIKEMRSILLNL